MFGCPPSRLSSCYVYSSQSRRAGSVRGGLLHAEQCPQTRTHAPLDDPGSDLAARRYVGKPTGRYTHGSATDVQVFGKCVHVCVGPKHFHQEKRSPSLKNDANIKTHLPQFDNMCLSFL